MFYRTTALEDYIKILYEKLGIFHPNERNIYDIAQQLKFSIHHTHFESQYVSHPFKLINLCTDQNHFERFEDFGHELFHALLDVGSNFMMPQGLRELREFKANNFMYHFCIPTFMLRKLELPSINTAGFIAETFGVTLLFAKVRLEHYQRRLFQCRLDEFNNIQMR